MKLALPMPWRRAAGWMRGSIGARVVALFLGLLLVVQVASFTALQASLTRHAHGALPGRLQVGARVLQSLLDRQAQTLSEGARLLAADYGFREAVSSDDTATIVSVLNNHGARIGATEAALVTTGFQLRAATSHDPRDLAGLVSKHWSNMLHREPRPALWVDEEERERLADLLEDCVDVVLERAGKCGGFDGFPVLVEPRTKSAERLAVFFDEGRLARLDGDVAAPRELR